MKCPSCGCRLRLEVDVEAFVRNPAYGEAVFEMEPPPAGALEVMAEDLGARSGKELTEARVHEIPLAEVMEGEAKVKAAMSAAELAKAYRERKKEGRK